MVGGKIQKDRAQQYVNGLAMATSKDGIHWDKPNLGLVEAPTSLDWGKFPPFPSPVGSSKENNLLGIQFGFVDLGQYGNVSDPARRYALAIEGQGYFAAELPDFAIDRDWRSKLTTSRRVLQHARKHPELLGRRAQRVGSNGPERSATLVALAHDRAFCLQGSQGMAL